MFRDLIPGCRRFSDVSSVCQALRPREGGKSPVALVGGIGDPCQGGLGRIVLVLDGLGGHRGKAVGQLRPALQIVALPDLVAGHGRDQNDGDTDRVAAVSLPELGIVLLPDFFVDFTEDIAQTRLPGAFSRRL